MKKHRGGVTVGDGIAPPIWDKPTVTSTPKTQKMRTGPRAAQLPMLRCSRKARGVVRDEGGTKRRLAFCPLHCLRGMAKEWKSGDSVGVAWQHTTTMEEYLWHGTVKRSATKDELTVRYVESPGWTFPFPPTDVNARVRNVTVQPTRGKYSDIGNRTLKYAVENGSLHLTFRRSNGPWQRWTGTVQSVHGPMCRVYWPQLRRVLPFPPPSHAPLEVQRVYFTPAPLQHGTLPAGTITVPQRRAFASALRLHDSGADNPVYMLAASQSHQAPLELLTHQSCTPTAHHKHAPPRTKHHTAAQRDPRTHTARNTHTHTAPSMLRLLFLLVFLLVHIHQ